MKTIFRLSDASDDSKISDHLIERRALSKASRYAHKHNAVVKVSKGQLIDGEFHEETTYTVSKGG